MPPSSISIFVLVLSVIPLIVLPPGPITMPDISAIDAVLDYEKNNYLFMVADPSNRGYHLFASNLSEHNKNRRAYIRWINSKGIYR